MFFCHILSHNFKVHTTYKNITDCTTANKLSLNLSKSEEMVFVDKWWKHRHVTPTTIDGLRLVTHTQYLNAGHHIHQRPICCASCPTLNDFKCSDFVCIKNSAGLWPVWEVNTGGLPLCNPGTVFVYFTCMVLLCWSPRLTKHLWIFVPKYPGWLLPPRLAQQWRPVSPTRRKYV